MTATVTAPPVRDRDTAKYGTPLTERELQVLQLLAGHTNGDIAVMLHLSEDTIKSHCRRLFGKLGAKDRAHAVHLGYTTGLFMVAPDDPRRVGDRHIVGCPALTPPPRCQCKIGGGR
ncbi:DNA-binding response regulator, LuxR family [Alloactinosynnema sp. L-07]|nr:DNA-binding response regulator, LuxR family [Alloactinosynnema sp. L-07]